MSHLTRYVDGEYIKEERTWPYCFNLNEPHPMEFLMDVSNVLQYTKDLKAFAPLLITLTPFQKFLFQTEHLTKIMNRFPPTTINEHDSQFFSKLLDDATPQQLAKAYVGVLKLDHLGNSNYKYYETPTTVSIERIPYIK